MSEKIKVSDAVQKTYETVKSNPKVKQAFDFLVPDQEKRLEEQIAIAKIPAFSYHEEERANAMKDYFRQYGLTDITTDRFGNVYGVRRGTGNGPKVLIDAHTDTVFPLYTKLEPKFEGNKVYMPGITDDASGLAAMLSVLRALNHEGIETTGDLYFAGIVEEEPGIFGMHKFIAENTFDAVISLDCAGSHWFAYGASSECDFEIRFRSMEERFSLRKYSPCLTAAARAAVKFSEYKQEERTFLLVDNITSDPHKGQGCTTSLTKLNIQVRACTHEGMAQASSAIRQIAEEACAEENARFEEPPVTFEIIKNEALSPAPQNPDNPICGAAYKVISEISGQTPLVTETGNSNSGAAIRAGIQAVTLGTGGMHGGIHSLDEFFDTTDMHKGPQSIMLIALMMTGIKDVCEPLA
ncbi:M20/M25/M40 family metallo-hydrolase [Emergencia sp. JLR.KK010]|uniref:M20 family metallopeptidase n=1 Tax=Emergencia sp. JLR.KK010 TaxID=3114296 RepID=UPI0030D4D2AB